VSLLRLVESQGYKPQRQGKDWAVGCLFHVGDNTSSLIISPKSNQFHCLSPVWSVFSRRRGAVT